MGKNFRGRRFRPDFRRKFNQPRHFEKNEAGEWVPVNLKQLKETDLGITVYLTPKDASVDGIIKTRFSDFHVNEIDADGKEAVLSNISVPEMPQVTPPTFEESSLVKDGLVSVQILQAIKEVVRSASSDAVMMDVTTIDKDARTKIHDGIKELFRGKVVASTLDKENGQKVIEIKRFDPNNREHRTDWNWPQEYVHFIMYKENIDTVQAIQSLGYRTRIKNSNFNYAGTKDKRAKTTQWVSVRQVEPKRLGNATKQLNMIFLGNFKFADKPLKLGSLKGNRFRVAIRDVLTPDDVIQQVLTKFQQTGFINYFGCQRFGNNAQIPTFEVGRCLIQQKWQEACELILKPRDGEAPQLKEMREHWIANRDAQAAREMLPKWSTFVEAKLLDGFIKTANTDYLGALNHLPRNMRLLYVHSYQSLIWNKIASRRIAEMGLNLRVGDLVFVKDEAEIRKDIEEFLSVDQRAEVEVGDAAAAGAEDDEVKDEPEQQEDPQKEEARRQFFKNLVRPLTQADVRAKRYTVYDIVLPLVGHDVSYPTNQVRQWYVDLLKQDGLNIDDLKQKHKIFSLAGTYRKLLAKADNFSHTLCYYDSIDENLILSDFEALRGDTLPLKTNGAHKAVILDFVLQPAVYATMALREILKKDTSPAAQIEENRKRTAVEETENGDSKKIKTE